MIQKTILRRFAPYFFFAAFVILACGVVGTDPETQTFSFNKSYDTLKQFDSVTITLRDTNGLTIDELYRGKADTIREIENRPAPHWKGGIAILSIVGYDDGVVVYHVDRRFNGKNDQILDTIRIILPGTELKADALEITLTEGDSIALPSISVTPFELSDRSLAFVSSAPLVLQVGAGFLRALQWGSAKLTATLKSNPAESLVLNITILRNPLNPDSLTVSPDTMSLAADGPLGALSAKISPASADAAVVWTVRDASMAQVTDAGRVQGLKAGQTVVVATSIRKQSLFDSAIVRISGPVAVAQVRFQQDSLELFAGGAAESLMVVVLPALANPKVEFITLEPNRVSITGSRVLGISEGKARIVARSVANPAAADTLSITVFPTQNIESVKILPDTLRLYTGGVSGMLSAMVLPLTMNQSVLWRVVNPAIASVDAAGKVSASGPGTTLVESQSRADSTKKDSAVVLVKRDMPQVNAGRDTVVPLNSLLAFRPVVAQEFGGIALFRWDLNGDGAFDGSSDSIRTVSMTYADVKEIAAAFYIKDTEGNDTTVYRKVKAVLGPAVQILEPKDSTFTRLFSIDVKWTVNNKEQDSLKKQTLVLGTNTLTRTALDEGGNPYSAKVTVFVDTTPPGKPAVRASTVTGSKTPTWTWASGGGGGNGIYKHWLDVNDSSKGKETQDTLFTPSANLVEGTHTLFVSERDRAGNWSVAGSFTLTVDLTGPGAPKMDSTPYSPLNSLKPKWTWKSGGGGAGVYRCKVDSDDLTVGAKVVTAPSFAPEANLTEGSHTLYVQEQDSVGNWSASSKRALMLSIQKILGGGPVSKGLAWGSDMAFNKAGNLFVAYTDFGDDSAVTVKYFDGTTWQNPGKTDRRSDMKPAFVIDSRDNMYVGLFDALFSTGTVIRYDGSRWENFGPELDPAKYIHNIRLATDGLDSLYSLFLKSRYIVVEKKNTWTWDTLGQETFYPPGSGEFATAFAVTKSGKAYLAIGSGMQIYTHLFTGQTWETIGNQNPEASGFYHLSLALNEADEPYILSEDPDDKLTVRKLVNGSWVVVGNAGFSEGPISKASLTISHDGVPYVAYYELVLGIHKLTVVRLINSQWVKVGSSVLTPNADYISIKVNNSGIPLVLYQDGNNNNALSIMTKSFDSE